MDVIDTRHLFRPVSDRLVELLGSLRPDDWEKPTCYPTWRVREIVAHMVQTATYRLSAERDAPAATIAGAGDGTGSATPGVVPGALSFEQISAHIADANDAWASATAALSPRILGELASKYESELSAHMEQSELKAPGSLGVSWAGEASSPRWFDVAREFTERWHHQQQIREAVGAESIAGPEFLSPVIHTLVRCLPFWFDAAGLTEDAPVVVDVSGDAGGRWTLAMADGEWTLREGDDGSGRYRVELSEDISWKHWTRSITPAAAAGLIYVHGPDWVRSAFLASRAIMIND